MLLLQKATALDTWSVKTRSPELKSAIEDLLSVIEGLKDSRESMIKVFNALTQRVPKVDQAPTVVHKEISAQTERNVKVSDSRLSDNDGDRSTTILSAIAEVRAIVADQQGQLNGILSRSAKDDEINQRSDTSRERKRRKRARTRRRGESQSALGQTSHLEDEDEGPLNHSPSRQSTTTKGGASSWTEVVQRSKKTAKLTPATDKVDGSALTARTAIAKPRTRTRPTAILVKVAAEEFPELSRRIRSGASSEIIDDSVVGLRQAKSSGLLIEVRGDRTWVEVIRAEVAKVAGPEIEVRLFNKELWWRFGTWTSGQAPTKCYRPCPVRSVSNKIP